MFTSVSIFVFQVSYPKLGDLCWLVIPCALTTLDHWSPEVKVQCCFGFSTGDNSSIDCMLVPTLSQYHSFKFCLLITFQDLALLMDIVPYN